MLGSFICENKLNQMAKPFSKHLKYFFMLLLFLSPLLLIDKATVILTVNSLRTPFLDAFFKIITHLGDGLIIIPLLFIVLRFKLKWLAIFILAFIIHIVFVHLFKQGIMNGSFRPYMYFQEQGKLELLHFIDGVKIRKLNTFPSGHTATLFFIISFFALKFKNKRTTSLLLFAGFFIGFSRIYLLQHFHIDVYFGMLFGVLATAIAHKYIKKHPKVWHRNRVIISIERNKIPKLHTQRAV